MGMFTPPLETITGLVEQDRELIEALEAVLSQYRAWRKTQNQIRSQILHDFHLPSFPTPDQVCDLLQYFQVFADALGLTAHQLEEEIEETVNQFYDWLYD
jgi:hypothetical protein